MFEQPEEFSCQVEVDDIVKAVSSMFDYTFTGKSVFTAPDMGAVPQSFSIGLIVGPSGSGKSTLLRRFGKEDSVEWQEGKAVCSHFASADDARDRLGAVGFNSIPSWMRPYSVLSTGEKFRADMARRLRDGAVFDEFTSVVDRNVAASCSNALRRYVDAKGLRNLVFASCHYDIIDWLRPDWVFDTNTNTLVGRGSLQRPEIVLETVPCGVQAWSMFRHHHYLNYDINRGARCWITTWKGIPVGFSSAIAFPSGTVRNAWREHRTVVLPEFQGLGIGVRISDTVGEMFLSQGCRYFSKTSHPRMGEYRNRSPLWKATSKNGISRKDYLIEGQTHLPSPKARPGMGKNENLTRHAMRVCYSHEYIGEGVSL